MSVRPRNPQLLRTYHSYVQNSEEALLALHALAAFDLSPPVCPMFSQPPQPPPLHHYSLNISPRCILCNNARAKRVRIVFCD